ncbi:MAG: MerR family DNA-binding transcriptional regulator [Chloroflexi bacterium]|nr:MerR family DNA-binding transcriptional regulator [Chloroflexota bacterium]
MADRLREDWLSLSGAAALIGVHPSTLRLWSDKGVFPVHRTSGGHRRYLRGEIDLWIKTSDQKNVMEPASAMQSAVGQMRIQIAEGRLEAELWYQKLNQEARMQYRLSGMTLVHGLMNYLSSQDVDASSEAYVLGYDYASRARRFGLSSIDATQAFLFFRNSLLEALVNAYEDARVPPGLAWGKMLNKIHTFTDQILVDLLKTYQAFDESHS